MKTPAPFVWTCVRRKIHQRSSLKSFHRNDFLTFGFESHYNSKRKAPLLGCFSFWLRNRDSNPNKQSQSLSCYRYTIPQYLLCFSQQYPFYHKIIICQYLFENLYHIFPTFNKINYRKFFKNCNLGIDIEKIL